MKNSIFPMLGLVIMLVLGACNRAKSPEVKNTLTPTQNQIGLPATSTQEPTSKPTVRSTATPTLTATIEVLTLTDTPEQGLSPLPTLGAGQPITLTAVHMMDQTIGWANEFNGRIVRTTDSGQTWKDVTPSNLIASGYVSFFLDAKYAWAYDYSNPTNGLVQTIDGGKTWSILTKSLPYVNDITFSNQKDGWAEAADMGAGQAYITLYATHDGGVTWNQINLNQPDGSGDLTGTLHLCSICGDSFYYDPLRLIITYGDLISDPVGSVHLSLSTDLGKTWKDLQLPLPDNIYADGLVAPQLPVFFNDQDGLLPFGIIRYNSDGSHAYAVLAVYATHDGGLSWKPNPTVVDNVQNLEGSYRLVDFVSPMDAFVTCGNDLCVTHDADKTWQTLKSNLNFAYVDGSAYVWQFDFVSPTTGWAITTDGNTYALWKTTDGGKTWGELKPKVADGQ